MSQLAHTLEPSRAALLVIDMQRGFLNEHTVHLPDRIAAFLEAQGAAFAEVLATRFVSTPDCLFRQAINPEMMCKPHDIDLAPSLAGQELRTLDLDGYASVDERWLAGARERGIDAVALCGVDTDQCVLATAFRTFDAGLMPFLLTDLCASGAGEHFHQIALELAERAFGTERLIESSALARVGAAH